MTITFKEFPTIPIPMALMALGFEDYSWHQDLAARIELPLLDGPVLHCWVDCPNILDRQALSASRFTMTLHPANADGYADCDIELATVYDGESEAECTEKAKQFITFWNSYHDKFLVDPPAT